MDEFSKKKRLKIPRIILLFLTLFISIGAFAGGIVMLIDPSGKMLKMNLMLPYFQVLPFAEYLFQDFVFSGISLIIVNGISNLIASILIIKNKKIGYILGFIFGITLMLWICIQFYIFPPNFMDILYFILGLIQFIVGFMSFVFYKQTIFYFNELDYKNINKNSKTVVVYFSRMGYSKKLAYEIANANSYDVSEIKTSEFTKDTLGFWWCGRFGMHSWKMPLSENYDLTKYEHVIIVSANWVFKICAPVREFLSVYKEELEKKLTDIYLTHFNPSICQCAYKELNQYINNDVNVHSYQSMYGNLKKR
ncbi:MAG: hypothetical protein SOU19_07210 [Candidatus Caccosoma sp.]|nr:hypothetical protein [Candidatus Caccosoma sp.]